MTEPQEIELKFFLSEEDAASLARSEPLARAAAQDVIDVRTRYFDTPEHSLKEKGIFVRVRENGDAWLQSVKESYGVDRFEFEQEIDQPTPRLDFSRDVPILGRAADADALQEIFMTHVRRKPFLLASETATIEVVIDEGEISTPDGETLPISELEVELKTGDPLDVFRLARRLAEQASLSLSLVSKGERGFLLAEGRWGSPHKASKARLSRDMTVAECFAAVCRVCLHDFMLNQIGRPQADVIESVHQTRVATRRLRAALGFFKSVVEDGAFAEMRAGIKWISGLLGTARDFDVWQTEWLEPQTRRLPGRGLRQLAAAVTKERNRAHLQLDEALASERLRRLLFDFTLWLEHGDWRAQGGLANSAPIPEFLDRRMTRAIRKLRRQGRKLRSLNEHEQHELRIQAKTLRYNLEFFEGVAKGRKNRRALMGMLKGLEEMQSSIGLIHDEVALSDFLSERFANMGPAADRRLRPAAAFALGRLAAPPRDLKKLHRKAERGYKRFAKERVDWA